MWCASSTTTRSKRIPASEPTASLKSRRRPEGAEVTRTARGGAAKGSKSTCTRLRARRTTS
eukprot:13295087-Alexandrium_andersonii.AAC.1